MKKIVIVFLFALFCITINAQIEQLYKPIIMQLEDGKDVKEYVVSNYYHSMVQYDDTVRSISVTMTLESLIDDFLVKWIADFKMEKNGKIMIKNRKTGEIIGEYLFRGAKISSFSENHYGSSYPNSYEQENNLTLVLLLKEYVINGIELKNIKSYSY